MPPYVTSKSTFIQQTSQKNHYDEFAYIKQFTCHAALDQLTVEIAQLLRRLLAASVTTNCPTRVLSALEGLACTKKPRNVSLLIPETDTAWIEGMLYYNIYSILCKYVGTLFANKFFPGYNWYVYFVP